jgi:hypothetical protein
VRPCDKKKLFNSEDFWIEKDYDHQILGCKLVQEIGDPYMGELDFCFQGWYWVPSWGQGEHVLCLGVWHLGDKLNILKRNCGTQSTTFLRTVSTFFLAYLLMSTIKFAYTRHSIIHWRMGKPNFQALWVPNFILVLCGFQMLRDFFFFWPCLCLIMSSLHCHMGTSHPLTGTWAM